MTSGDIIRTPVLHEETLSLVHESKDDDEVVDYNSSLEHVNMEICVVHLNADYYVISEKEVALVDFGPKEGIF